MHGSSAGTPVPLTTLGGLVTLASPDSLPEGASPRCYDNDYIVGQTQTRDGLTCVNTFAGSYVGPSTGGTAVDTSLGGVAWTNPGNALLNTGVYATASISTTLNVSAIQIINVTQGWAGHLIEEAYALVTFASKIPVGDNATVYSFSGQTGYTGLNGRSYPQYLSQIYALTAYQAFFYLGLASLFPVYGPTSDTGTAVVSNALFATDALDIKQFGFSAPSTATPQGFVIPIISYSHAAGTTLSVQMLKAGVPVGDKQTLVLSTDIVTINFGGPNSLFGASWLYSDLNSTLFGLRITAESRGSGTIYVGYTLLKAYYLPSQSNFDFLTTFTAQNGSVKNIYLNANGELYTEDVTNTPGVLTLAETGITPNSFAVGVNGPDVEYLAFNDLTAGSDMPRQWTPNWIDRITQVGPGKAPAFAANAATTDTFAIATITQNAAKSSQETPGTFSQLLWSSGPGSTTAGNVVTVYYSPHDGHPTWEDTVLDAAFNNGQAVYVHIVGAAFGNGTFAVTSVGAAQPPGLDHSRWYFTFQVPTSNYQQVNSAVGTYQMTVATMGMSVAVPGLSVGNQVTISAATATGYNNVWPISQTLDSGTMTINETAVASGIATYTYSLLSGVAPVAGHLVTITGTTNANGALNLVDARIATATGGSSGSFTVLVSSPNATTAAEQGQAVTAGTIFEFDPGLTTLGTLTSPIYGSSTGGTLTFGGASGQFIGVGTRQGSVFFITRNGYWTAPAAPVTFTCPSNTKSIIASLIPIGPPDVVARGIILTEPGQNGVPGANFFTIPDPVDYTVQNVQYTADSLIINDNTSTSATFFFTDYVLLNALAVDVQGFNLFNQIEIGDPGWIKPYASRNFYGLCLNKLQNFNNLSFDGGYLPASVLNPLGWTAPDAYGKLLVSPVFGNSYYIKNTTEGGLSVAGLISQTAYQDFWKQPILNANTSYSVRISARIPSSLTTGALVISLTANGVVYGSYTLLFSSMTSAFATYTGTLLINQFPTVPAALMLNCSAVSIGSGADVEIDRFDVFPTAIPVLTTAVYGSYANDVEQVDGVTGKGVFASENQQPVNGAVVMYDTFYGLKESSMYSWRSSPNLEPAQWEEPEVAQRAGSGGINAYDFGEQWLVEACENGCYLYEGGQPGKINQEIYQVWKAINWQQKKCIWVRNDVVGRRLFIGAPMATPNFWLPDAPVNANPTSPNVILMCNYQGLDTASEMKVSPGMHTTMFGTLNAIDMRRKWSIWQIPSPYAAFVKTAEDQAFYICNGLANSKIYALDQNASDDDGTDIDSLYTTYGFPDASTVQKFPALGLGNIRIGYMNFTGDVEKHMDVRFLPNQLIGPGDSTVGYNAWTVPGGFEPNPASNWNRKATVNFFANRAYVEFRGAGFRLSALALTIVKDVWNAPWGPK